MKEDTGTTRRADRLRSSYRSLCPPHRAESAKVKKNPCENEGSAKQLWEYSIFNARSQWIEVDNVENGLVENEQTVLTLKDTNFLLDVDDKSEDHKHVLQSVDA